MVSHDHGPGPGPGPEASSIVLGNLERKEDRYTGTRPRHSPDWHHEVAPGPAVASVWGAQRPGLLLLASPLYKVQR